MICVVAVAHIFFCLHLCYYLLSCVYEEDKQMWASSQKCATAPPPHCTLQAPVMFFLPGQMGCSTYTWSTHTHPNTRCAPPLPCNRPLEVMVNCGSVKDKEKKRRKNKQKHHKHHKHHTHTYTLTSPIIHHIITITIHSTIYLRYGEDSRWFKILNQNQSQFRKSSSTPC